MIKSISLAIVASLLFSIVGPPVAQANIWEDRRKTLEEMKSQKKRSLKALKPRRKTHSPLAVQGFDLPAELGTVVEAWGGGKSLEAKVNMLQTILPFLMKSATATPPDQHAGGAPTPA